MAIGKSLFCIWSRHCISRNNCHISQFFALCPTPKWSNWSDNFLSMIFGILGEIGIEIVEHIFYIEIFFSSKIFSSKNKKYFSKSFPKKSKFQKCSFLKLIFRRKNLRKNLISKNIFEIKKFREKKSSENQF